MASLWGPWSPLCTRQILKGTTMDCCSPIPDTWFFMTLSLGSPRGLSLPSSRADSEEAGRRTRLCFSHHGDKKLSQIFAYDFTGEAKQGRLDWKEEHLQKHIWKQQPKECWTLIQGLAGKGAFFIMHCLTCWAWIKKSTIQTYLFKHLTVSGRLWVFLVEELSE